MTNVLLTDACIRSLRPNSNQCETFDKKITGLGIRVSPGGTKSFIVLYRLGGRNRRLTLGSYPIVTLAEARSRAQEALSQVAKGIDPQDEKLRARENYQTNLFSSVVDEFIENHAKRNTKSWKETERILQNEFVRPWRNLQIQQITKQQINCVLDLVVKRSGPSAANHAFQKIRCFFNWSVCRGYIEKSPCAGMRTPAKTVERDRILSDDELTANCQAADKMSYPFGSFVRLLVLTAQRRDEVSSMRWDDLDLTKGLWTQPRDSNKSGRIHVVPLSRLAIETIRSLPRVHDEFVFPARGRDRPLSGYSKWKHKLDQLSGVKSWTLHDLRRTAATGMAALKVPLHIVELILNHRSKQLSGVAGIYNRHDYLDEQRNALEQWGEHVERLILIAQKKAASETADTRLGPPPHSSRHSSATTS